LQEEGAGAGKADYDDDGTGTGQQLPVDSHAATLADFRAVRARPGGGEAVEIKVDDRRGIKCQPL
jgi:hypothetical protein